MAVLKLAEIDVHAVAGLMKLYLRELPESLFTNKLYNKFVHGLSENYIYIFFFSWNQYKIM